MVWCGVVRSCEDVRAGSDEEKEVVMALSFIHISAHAPTPRPQTRERAHTDAFQTHRNEVS